MVAPQFRDFHGASLLFPFLRSEQPHSYFHAWTLCSMSRHCARTHVRIAREQYPFVPAHITKPKECKKLFLVQMPERSTSLRLLLTFTDSHGLSNRSPRGP